MRKRSAEEKQKQLERFLMNVAEAADAALWEYWREKEAEHRRFATEYVTRRGAYPATVTAWQTAGGQGKLHFPYAAWRQLACCRSCSASSKRISSAAVRPFRTRAS